MIGLFAATVFFLIITPGPGVLSAAGVGAGFGFRASARWIAGLYLGSNAVGATVFLGLAAFVLDNPNLRLIMITASSLYLLYLAFKVATAGGAIGISESSRPPSIAEGVGLQFMNPKAYVVNTALISGFPIYPAHLGIEILIKLLVFTAIWYPIHLAYGYLGASLKRLDLPERTQRMINFAMGAALVIVVVLALYGAFFVDSSAL